VKHYHQHYSHFWPKLEEARLGHWQNALEATLETALDPDANGNLPKWLPALETIMMLPSSDTAQLNQSAIKACSPNFSGADREQLTQALKAFMPWRKGPFDIEGVYIDTEWHSDWKWDRISPHLSSLKGRKVLDIGCGSGYHLWRMLGDGAEFALGVDPGLLFMTQFLAIKHFVGESLPAYFLPLTLEQLPKTQPSEVFDTVFSMGVLYHRLSPIDHLKELRCFIRKEGELVLETLVIEGDDSNVLIPEDRYAFGSHLHLCDQGEPVYRIGIESLLPLQNLLHRFQ